MTSEATPSWSFATGWNVTPSMSWTLIFRMMRNGSRKKTSSQA